MLFGRARETLASIVGKKMNEPVKETDKETVFLYK
jgi:hypothetical protein